MRCSLFRLTACACLTLVLSGGCPTESTDESPSRNTPANAPATSVGSSGSSSASSSETVGPPAPGGDLVTEVPGSDGVTTNVQRGAPSGGTPDALTVRFPDCFEPTLGDAWAAEILRLVNQARAQEGRPALRQSVTLTDQAAAYACELIQFDFFAHVNPRTGSTLQVRSADAGYQYWIIGENLAAGQANPAEAFRDWMNSPCHRENIMNPAFTELGVSIRSGGEYGTYWVQEFGRPLSAGPYNGPTYRDPECTHE